jgi:Flp pilus assembly protein TadD
MIRNINTGFVICFILLFNWQATFAQDGEFQQLLARGIDSLQTGNDLQRAQTICNRIIDKYKSDKEMQHIVLQAYLIQGKIFRRMGLRTSDFAISALERGLELNPNNSDLNREMGLILKDVEKYSEARIYLEKTVRLNKNDHLAWRALVELNEKLGNSTQKIFAYQGYLSVSPGDAGIWTKLGEEYIKVNNVGAAEGALMMALEIDPNQTSARYQLALLKEERGDLTGAIAEYRTMLQSETKEDFDKSLARHHITVLLKQVKADSIRIARLLEPVQDVNQALKGTNIDQLTQLNFRLQRLQREYPQDLEIIQKLREVRKRLFDLWFQRAKEYSRSEQTLQRAVAAYDSSFIYADTNADMNRANQGKDSAQAKLGVLHKAQKEFEEAEEAFKARMLEEAKRGFITAGQLSPSRRGLAEKKQVEVSYYLGLAAMDSSDWDKAAYYFSEVLKRDTTFMKAKVRYTEAQRHKQLSFLISRFKDEYLEHNRNIALATLQEILKIDPDNAYCIKKLAELQAELDTEHLRNQTLKIVGLTSASLLIVVAIWFTYRYVRKYYLPATAKESHFNPYVVGQPIDTPEMFFGRKSYIQRIQSAIKNHSLLLYGERRIGKTSILKQLERQLDKPYFVFYSDLENTRPEDFFSRIMRSLYNRLRSDFSAETQGLKIAQNPDFYTAHDFQDDFYNILNSLRRRYDPNVVVVMNLDEADWLNDYPINILLDLRRLLQEHSRDLRMVLTGVKINTTRQDDIKSSTLFAVEEQIEVKPLIRKEAEDLIRKPVAPFFSYDKKAIDYIIAKSDCKPNIIQKFCRYALSRLYEDRSRRTRIRLEDVIEVFQKDILREYADEYDKVWENFDEDARATLLEVVQNRSPDHSKAAKLLQQALHDKPYVYNNRLIYFENSHVHIFTPFKEWVMKNAV